MLVSAGGEELAGVVGYWDGFFFSFFFFFLFLFPLSLLTVFPCFPMLPGEGVPTRTLPFVRGRDVRASAGNGSRRNAVWFRTRVCIPPWGLMGRWLGCGGSPPG